MPSKNGEAGLVGESQWPTELHCAQEGMGGGTGFRTGAADGECHRPGLLGCPGPLASEQAWLLLSVLSTGFK